MAGDEDDRKRAIRLGEFPLEVEATEPRQPDIEHETPGCVRPGALQEILCRRERVHP